MRKNEKSFMLDIVETITAVLLIAMTVLVIVQVVSRFVFKSPVAQTDELSRYAMVWSALLGASIATRRKSHVAVTIIVEKFPQKLQVFFRVILYLLMGTFFVLLTWQGAKLVSVSMNQNSTTLPLKMGYVIAILPITGILNFVFVCMNAYDDFVRKEKLS